MLDTSQVSSPEGTIRRDGESYRDFASSSPRDDAGQLDSQVSSPEGTIRRDGESYRDFASSSPRDDAGHKPSIVSRGDDTEGRGIVPGFRIVISARRCCT